MDLLITVPLLGGYVGNDGDNDLVLILDHFVSLLLELISMVYPDIGNHGQNDSDYNLGWFCFVTLLINIVTFDD